MIKERYNGLKYYIGGLLFPVAGLTCALNKPQSKGFKELLVAFFAFIGLAFIYIPEGGVLGVNVGSDAAYYADEFVRVSRQKISYVDYYRSQAISNQVDYYLSFITWLVSRITSNPHIYFGVLTTIMGLFLASNVNYIVSKAVVSRQSKFLIILLVLIPNPVFYSHRWWTALQVFLFGTLPFILDNNNKRGLVAILSVFVHFTFLYPLIITILCKFLPKKSAFPYLILFLVFSLAEGVDFSGLLSVSEKLLPVTYNQRNEIYVFYELQEHNLLSQSAKIIWKYFNMVTSCYVYFRFRKTFEDNANIRHLFVLSLLFGSFSALTGMTEWGWRFFDLTNFCFCSLYILLLSDSAAEQIFKKYINLNSLFLLFIIMYQIRGIFSIIGLKNLLFGDAITAWLWNDNISVLDLIK